jgi:hypothetical protein
MGLNFENYTAVIPLDSLGRYMHDNYIDGWSAQHVFIDIE